MEASDIIPTLRFPKSRVRNRWVVSTIGEIFESLPTASYSRAYLSEEGSIGYIHYGDIHTKYNSYIDLSKVKLPSIPVELKKKYRYVKDGDLVLTDASEDYLGIGKAVEIINVGEHKTICGLHTILLRESQHAFCVGFKTYLFQSPTVKKQIERLSVGFKVNSITYNAIKDIQIAYPYNKQEQEKISMCLQSLEAIITANEIELTKLIEHKQALLQRFFPSSDRDIQNTSQKLKDIAVRRGKKNKDTEKLPVLTNSASLGIIRQTSYFEREIVSCENLRNYQVAEIDDFIYNPRISKEAPVGPISRNKIAKGLVSPLYNVFRIKKGNVLFYEQYFKSHCWHKYLRYKANNGARFDRMNISIKDLFEMPVYAPSISKQKQIAKILMSIDKLIDGFEAKTELLKLQKAGLLQQLFSQRTKNEK